MKNKKRRTKKIKGLIRRQHDDGLVLKGHAHAVPKASNIGPARFARLTDRGLVGRAKNRYYCHVCKSRCIPSLYAWELLKGNCKRCDAKLTRLIRAHMKSVTDSVTKKSSDKSENTSASASTSESTSESTSK